MIQIELGPEIEGLDIEILKDVIILGYNIYKNGLYKHIEEKTIKRHSEINEIAIEKRVTAAIITKEHEISALTSNLQIYKDLFHEKDEICSLLKYKEQEILNLKNTNHVKCFLGESLVYKQLSSWYPIDTIDNTGKTAHEGDIHWTYVDANSKSNSILIECKYKKQIQKIDIDKFYNDIKTGQQGCASRQYSGAIFISIITNNIPTKGDASIELLDNIPIMFLGFNSEEDFISRSKNLFDIFKKIVNICSVDKTKVDNKIDRCFMELNFFLNIMTKSRLKLEEFKAMFIKYYDNFSNEHNVIITKIEKLLIDNSQIINTSFEACSTCDQVFETKRKLIYHQKKCINK